MLLRRICSQNAKLLLNRTFAAKMDEDSLALEKLLAEKYLPGNLDESRIKRIENLIGRVEKSSGASDDVRRDAEAAKSMLKYLQTQLGIKSSDGDDHDEDEVKRWTARILRFQIYNASDDEMEDFPR